MKSLLQLLMLVAVSLGLAQGQPSSASPDSSAKPAISLPQTTESPSPLAAEPPASGDVDLRFELPGPAPSSEPKLLVQLDSNEPVQAGDADQAISNLQPGLHTARVTLVDGNNRPVRGGSGTVRFKVPAATESAPAGDSPAAAQLLPSGLSPAPPALPVPPELRSEGDLPLPSQGSPLPLVSLIGFGLLIGIMMSALRAHRDHRRTSVGSC